MKSNLILEAYLAVALLAGTSIGEYTEAYCFTSVDTTPGPSSISTTYETTTIDGDLTFTYILDLDGGTTTTYVPFTYVTIVADTTTLIPTGSDFYPATNAPTNSPTGTPRVRSGKPSRTRTKKPSPAAATTLSKVKRQYPYYDQAVTCYETDYTGTTTTKTETYYTTATIVSTSQSHTTSHVATYTGYAACEHSSHNIMHSFKGTPINSVQAVAFFPLCLEDDGGSTTSADCATPRQCCDAIQRNNANGFLWTRNGTQFGNTGIQCYMIADWGFDIGELGEGERRLWVGNGPQGFVDQTPYAGNWGTPAG